MKSFIRFYLLLTIFFASCQTNTKTKSAYDFLRNISMDVNQKCPIQVDSIIRLENTIAHPIATFRYNYTLKYDTVRYDIHEFEKSLRQTTLNTVKTSPDGKIFRDLFTTLEYNYSDTLGNFLFRIVIKPEDYK